MERERATGAENEAGRRGDRRRGRERERGRVREEGAQAREQRWGEREEDSGPGGGSVRARYTEKESSATGRGKHPGRCGNKSMMSVTEKGMEQQVVDGGKRLESEVRRPEGRDSRETRERRRGGRAEGEAERLKM